MSWHSGHAEDTPWAGGVPEGEQKASALIRQLKNRIHATLAKYALHDIEVSDLFGVRGRVLLRQRLEQSLGRIRRVGRQPIE
jgi:hypothetical protein